MHIQQTVNKLGTNASGAVAVQSKADMKRKMSKLMKVADIGFHKDAIGEYLNANSFELFPDKSNEEKPVDRESKSAVDFSKYNNLV